MHTKKTTDFDTLHPVFFDAFQKVNASLYSILDELRGKAILITGGTGFFGKWLLGYLCCANTLHQLNLKIYVVSRNPHEFFSKSPEFLEITKAGVYWIQGDIRTFKLTQPVDFVIHAATEASEKLNQENPAEMLSVTTAGTLHLLEECKSLTNCRILMTSSGAVYGTQGTHTIHQLDDCLTGPDTLSPKSAYAEGKRISELLGAIHAAQTGQTVVFARCYAFVGPYLPLDTHFAIGNFILNCLNDQTISIKGDGTPHRSYMYAADLVVWLLTLLLKGENRTSYNVGSEESVSISELARRVALVWETNSGKKIPIEIFGRSAPGSPILRYVPSTARARETLSLSLSYSLDEAISESFRFYATR